MSVRLTPLLDKIHLTVVLNILIRCVLLALVVPLTLLLLPLLHFLFFAGHYIFEIIQKCINITDQIYIVLRNTTFFDPQPAYPTFFILLNPASHPSTYEAPIALPLRTQFENALLFESEIHVGQLNYCEWSWRFANSPLGFSTPVFVWLFDSSFSFWSQLKKVSFLMEVMAIFYSALAWREIYVVKIFSMELNDWGKVSFS